MQTAKALSIRAARIMGAVLALWLPVGAEEPAAAADPAPRWYKGNTHAHTELCGHADSSPAAVAGWYLDHGYNFLTLSEHNRLIDPATVALPADRREDFILIPGQEVTGDRVVHTTALNVHGLVPWGFKHRDPAKIIQYAVDGVRAAGGEPILNHPNFHSAIKAEHLQSVKHLHLFELYNGHPATHNFGTKTNPPTETLWDLMLEAGWVLYGVAADDAHQFKTIDPKLSNPGRGWVMVRSRELTPDAITEAMRAGDFYASSGVILKDVQAGVEHYSVVVDPESTARELAAPILAGRETSTGPEGWRIEVIGPTGVLSTALGQLAIDHPIGDEHAWLRVLVTFSRKTADAYEEFYAWTQPVFTDGRVEARK